MLRGFDVSHWQGELDWPALHTAHGISFGACKATEAETFRDPEFPYNWASIGEVGIRIAYAFARPDENPRDDVAAFLDYVNPDRPTDLLCLDLETGGGLSQDAVSAWAEAWAAECRTLAPAYVPGIYMGSAYLTNRTGQGLRGPFGWLWYPRYPAVFRDTAVWPDVFMPPPPVNRDGAVVSWSMTAWGTLPNFWQFSQSFVSGQGNIDANLFNGSLEDLRSLNGR